MNSFTTFITYKLAGQGPMCTGFETQNEAMDFVKQQEDIEIINIDFIG